MRLQPAMNSRCCVDFLLAPPPRRNEERNQTDLHVHDYASNIYI